MSRFTISVLLATALLGILLWIVLGTVAQLANPTAVRAPSPTIDATPTLDPALPRINTDAQLSTWVAAAGPSASIRLANYRNWLTDRGYPADAFLLGATRSTGAASAWADEDDATLLVFAGRGDIGALHELAERSLNTDPSAALAWYDQAIINGSLFAMLRVSELLATLGNPDLQNFSANPAWEQSLIEIAASSPPPLERSLAWAIGAVHVGGYGLVSMRLAGRISALTAQLDEFAVARACETAQSYVLGTAAARRAQGGAVFSMQRPDFAISVAEPDAVLPCEVPVPPLVDMSNCDYTPFVAPGEQLMYAWFCP